MKKLIIILFFFIFACSSESQNANTSLESFESDIKFIQEVYDEFSSKEYQEDGTYKHGSFEYDELKSSFYKIFDKIQKINLQVDDNNLEMIYHNVLDDSYIKLVQIGYLLYDPSNDYSIDYSDWYDDHLSIFETIIDLSKKVKISRESIMEFFYYYPDHYANPEWIELVINNYFDPDDIINDFQNGIDFFYAVLFSYTMVDYNYNIVVGDLADTFNEVYRKAKSKKINNNVNFNFELEFNGFYINAAAANHYSTTSDFKNSYFYLNKSIDYLNAIDFNNLSSKKLFFLENIHSSFYDLFFDSMIPNSKHIAQNSNNIIFAQTLENFFQKIKILEDLNNISNQLIIPAEYIEENIDFDLLIKNNVIYLSRIVNYYNNNSYFSDNLPEDLGSNMKSFNYYSEKMLINDWYVESMTKINKMNENLSDNLINQDEYFKQVCMEYKLNLDEIFKNVTISDIQSNPENYFDHFSYLKDSINMVCSDEIIDVEFKTVGVPYNESVWIHDIILIDRINEVFSIKNDTDKYFLDYLYSNSIDEAKKLTRFFNDYFNSYNANFIIYNISEMRNNLVETGIIYLITKADSNQIGNSFKINTYEIDYEDVTNLLYDLENFNELIGFKADISSKSAKIYDLLIKPFKQDLEEGAYSLFILDPSLHNMPIEILIDEEEKYLFETTDIIRSHTLKDFISGAFDFAMKINTPEQRMDNFQRFIGITKNVIDPTILAFGDVEYSSNGRKVERIKRDNSLGALPYTLNEIQAINKIVRQSKVFSGKKASESNFKKLSSGTHSIIHFATHGLSFYNNFKNSSILLANDNYNDGLLTYAEILQLDLDNVDLVFLSACNTNFARNFRNISSPSIQQAFKSAGVNTVISTMWPINDLSTSLFVEIYYSEYLKTGLSFKALQNTRKIFIETYPEYNHPYYWAAFTQFGI